MGMFVILYVFQVTEYITVTEWFAEFILHMGTVLGTWDSGVTEIDSFQGSVKCH